MTEQSGVRTPEQESSGILGLNEKLGIGRLGKKKAPKKRPQMGFGNMPDLAGITMADRKANHSGMPGGKETDESASPLDRAKNRVARSFKGGSKKGIFG